MLVMVVFFMASRWIHLSTPLIRLFLLVLILLLMPTLNFLPVWFALSLLRFRLPSRLPMMFFFQAEAGIRDFKVTGVQTCALPICGSYPPPDPTLVASPIDPSTPTDFAAATQFLYYGLNRLQPGVAPGTISPAAVAVLRGRDRKSVV